MARKKPRNLQQEHFELNTIHPITNTQKDIFQAYNQGYNLILHGYAGTGKTFISLYLALNEVLYDPMKKYGRVIILRSVVPSRDMGFLPGTASDKARAYEEPYYEICSELFDRSDNYEVLKRKQLVQFTTTSFLRGLTFNNAIVILDEAQNCSYSELSTIITRLGHNSRFIVCGDFRQTDLKNDSEKAGLNRFLTITRRMQNEFAFFEMTKDDIVRSPLVKEFIIKEAEYNDRDYHSKSGNMLGGI